MTYPALTSRLNLVEGTIEGAPVIRRHLGDLKGVFADTTAFARALQMGDGLLYTVSSVETAPGEGQLSYALGKLMPGQIGREYYMTKGHFHAWRAAAEVYLGLQGEGLMILENESGESRSEPLGPQGIVYVPGHTAHRTVNIGKMPLLYLGIYPAAAGHDYAAIAERNFRKVVIERDGRPVMLDRAEFQV